ncbi:MAG: immunoglobulin-like domain-containing protein [Gammaproteobacteria bacterium]
MGTTGVLCAILLVSGCGGSSELPCSGENVSDCLVTVPAPVVNLPPADAWWDTSIVDFSENPDRPTISLLGDRTKILSLGEDYLEDGATALDVQDGDLSTQIMIEGQVDSSTVGDYLVRYSVTDSSNTVAIEKIRIVRVMGNSAENLSRRPINSTISNFGYLEHLPLDYGQTTAEKPPLLFYLHGSGGNVEFAGTTDPTLALDTVIDNFGVPKLIEDGDWDDTLPFVVLAPQLGAVASAEYRERLEAFFEFAISSYDIDTSRVYLAGYSAGGALGAAFARDNPDRITAFAAVAPAFPFDIDPTAEDYCNIEPVPFWLFHATNDEVVPFINSTKVFNEVLDFCDSPVLPKLSLVIGGEHAIHHAVYNLDALVGGASQAVYDSRYDPYDMSIYQWLLGFSLADRP